MNEFTFKENWANDGWLSAKSLKEGHVYIIKDGRIALYLGKTITDKYLFYVYCIMQFKSLNNDLLSFANYDIQVPSIINMCNACMQHKIYKESLLELKGIPKIYCEFPFVEYSKTYKQNWYTKAKIVMQNLPALSSMVGVKASAGFVGAKDLIPGNLYYSGGCWRSTYVYLGRTSDKEFVWYFVGNENILVRSTAYELLKRTEITKSNKKVKPLSQALKDKDACVCGDTENLIKMNYKVDMSGITQEMLDAASFNRRIF